jgi:hypothetical protein
MTFPAFAPNLGNMRELWQPKIVALSLTNVSILPLQGSD